MHARSRCEEHDASRRGRGTRGRSVAPRVRVATTVPRFLQRHPDPGPGSRAQASAHDFGGIGRTDTGGRDFCGAVPAGQAEYYTYYDDGTGFLAVFDPYFEIRPQVAANMCVYFDCASIACPGGTTVDSLGGHPGCCWDASAGTFTGHRIDFCTGARVTLKVTSTSTCAGYEAHFHD